MPGILREAPPWGFWLHASQNTRFSTPQVSFRGRCFKPLYSNDLHPHLFNLRSFAGGSLYDELREDVMIWVMETRIFESDQSELQSVVRTPTLYVVKICGNCILNAKIQRNSSNSQFHCLHFVRNRAPCWRDLFLMETRETKTHFSQCFSPVWLEKSHVHQERGEK